MLRRLIFSKFRAILGGKVRTLLSGGAPLAADTHDFIRTCLVTRLLQASTLTIMTITLERILIQSFSEFLIRNSEFLHTSDVWKYVGGGGRGLGAGGVAGGRPEHGRHRRLQVHQPEVEVALRTSRD